MAEHLIQEGSLESLAIRKRASRPTLKTYYMHGGAIFISGFVEKRYYRMPY